MNNNIKFPVPRVSYFKGPVTDIRPAGVCDLREIGEMIRRDERLECLTREYRALTDKEERREFKKTRLPYITPSGVFSKRMADGFVRHSGLVCLDFDDVRNYDLLRCDLLHDKCYETAFLFRSPSGGLKWFVCLPWMNEANDQRATFDEIRAHVLYEYGADADKSGSDVCRACFLCHDENVFINHKFLAI